MLRPREYARPASIHNLNAGEPEAFTGGIVALGAEFGVPTPVHRAAYALLKPARVEPTWS